jgi:hypothetical protein
MKEYLKSKSTFTLFVLFTFRFCQTTLTEIVGEESTNSSTLQPSDFCSQIEEHPGEQLLINLT